MEIILSNETEEELKENYESIINIAINKVGEIMELKGDWEVSVSIVNPEEIRMLNSEYRGVDEITDVLSFPLDFDVDVPMKMLGDIVINLEKIKSQALEFNHSEERELSYLTVHSMLHLLGFDHIDEEDRVEMRKKENEIMEELGILR
ncbi:MAG: rRNA maturation RNase YbeY [Tissierellia bacterium]|nr:rRNA maturation RNase YbeY [Tissierellia bacterium]